MIKGLEDRLTLELGVLGALEYGLTLDLGALTLELRAKVKKTKDIIPFYKCLQFYNLIIHLIM